MKISNDNKVRSGIGKVTRLYDVHHRQQCHPLSKFFDKVYNKILIIYYYYTIMNKILYTIIIITMHNVILYRVL